MRGRDPMRGGVDQIERRDLSPLEALHRFGRGQPAQFIVGSGH